MIPLLLLVALAATQPELPVGDTEPDEGRCDYLTSEGAVVPPPPGLHVVADTRGDGPYAPAIPAGASIRCERSVIVPAANDWKVLAAGHPLYIVEAIGDPHPRLGSLEVSQGRVRFRLLRGNLKPDEQPRVMARLNEFQLHLRR